MCRIHTTSLSLISFDGGMYIVASSVPQAHTHTSTCTQYILYFIIYIKKTPSQLTTHHISKLKNGKHNNRQIISIGNILSVVHFAYASPFSNSFFFSFHQCTSHCLLAIPVALFRVVYDWG